MRWFGCLIATIAVAVVLVAATAIRVLSTLDQAEDVEIGLLMVGDLRQFLFSVTFRDAFPAWPNWRDLVAVGPMIMMTVFGGGLLFVRRRHRKLPAAIVATLALLLGLVPMPGAVALQGNTVESSTGPWLRWMLLGPLYAAVLALAFLVAGLLAARPARSRGAALRPAHV